MKKYFIIIIILKETIKKIIRILLKKLYDLINLFNILFPFKTIKDFLIFLIDDLEFQ